jgi:hypothetical protein
MSEPRPRTVPELAGDAVRESRELVSTEIALLRAEVAEGLRHLMLALGLFIAAGVLVLTALLAWIFALVKGLAVLLQSDALAALVVGGAFAVIAVALALVGRGKASLSGLEPTRTERQVRRDAAIITERMDE